MLEGFAAEPLGPTDLFVGKYLIISPISLVNMRLIRSSFKSYLSFGELCFSRNLFISSKFSNYLCKVTHILFLPSKGSIVMFPFSFLSWFVLFLSYSPFLEVCQCSVDFPYYDMSFFFFFSFALFFIISVYFLYIICCSLSWDRCLNNWFSSFLLF